MSNHEKVGGGFILQPMDPGVRLFRTWQFQLSILIPLSLAVLCFWIISAIENLNFQFSSEGVRNLWEYHKLSLTLLGLTFPSTALVASHHRSIQSAEQIKQQQNQNMLTNHFLHTEEFIRVWKELELPDQSNLSKSFRAIHANMFPSSVNGNHHVSDNFIENLEELFRLGPEFVDSVRLHPKQSRLSSKLKMYWKQFEEMTGIKAPSLPTKPEIYPSTTLFIVLRALAQHGKKIIELGSFLPPADIRSLNHEIDAMDSYLQSQLETSLEREARLERISEDLDTRLNMLGEGLHAGQLENLERLNADFDQLVRSGDFSDEEIEAVFPWDRATSRLTLLSKDMKDWITKKKEAKGGS